MIDQIKELQVFNRITFLDSTHTYQIDGKPSAKVSVTRLIDGYKIPFEKEKWAKIKADKLGLTTEEIIQDWGKQNLYSTTLGTIVHNFIDNYYNNKIVPYDKVKVEEELGRDKYNELKEHVVPLINQFYNFYNDKDYILPIKNEFVVGDIEDTRICGMLDMLAYNTKDNTFEIYDFKTNKEIKYKTKFNKYLRPPVSHLEECEFNTYSIQLSLYKYFIEAYTSIKIDKTFVVWFSTKNDDYQLIPLLNMDKEVKDILDHFSLNNNNTP
jgi:hypothetical protein